MCLDTLYLDCNLHLNYFRKNDELCNRNLMKMTGLTMRALHKNKKKR